MSDKYSSKLFELLEDQDIESVDRMLFENKAKKIGSNKFNIDFIKELKSDLKILKDVNSMWVNVNKDPKLDKFVKILNKEPPLKNRKIIVFTESKETGEYLKRKLDPLFKNKVLAYSSKSSVATRDRIIDNFAPASKSKKDDVKILVTTEILSEGVNLNRSNIVINYDIPWNPIRMMQRVGRINRVGKNLPFDEIYTYNFFPAGPINEQISLTELAVVKIQSFIEMLGNDAKLLTNEDIKSHELFERLNSKETLMGENETNDPELEWLLKLRGVRDNDPKLFEKINKLPKKSRTSKKSKTDLGLFTFFRKGKLRKLYYNTGSSIHEIDFAKAVDILKSAPSEPKLKLTPEFYRLLEQNKKEFGEFFIKSATQTGGSSRGHEGKLKMILKALLKNPQGLTDDDEDYLNKVLGIVREGAVPKESLRKINKAIKKEDVNPAKILARIKQVIPENSEFFKETYASYSENIEGSKEIILSEMLFK